MSELQNPLATELHARVRSILNEIDLLFVRVRTLTEDSLALRNHELSMDGVRAGFSLNEAEAYLKKLQRSLRWAINGILPPAGDTLDTEEANDA